MRAALRPFGILMPLILALPLAACQTDGLDFGLGGGEREVTAADIARAWVWIPDPTPLPKAAEDDLTLAMRHLNGIGVERDLRQGLGLLQRAANRGDGNAAYLLARLYEEGVGGPKDPTGAIDWLERAAEFGQPEAQYRLAMDYYRGRGRPLNTVAGVRWLQAAAQQGHADAQYQLGIAHHLGRGTLRDELRAMSWLEAAAEQDHTLAQYLAGDAYSDGWHGPSDMSWAARWYGRAAWLGLKRAQYKMALFHMGGFGVPKDLVLAYKWAYLAATEGEQSAADLKQNLEQGLSPDQLRYGQALAVAWRPPLPDPAFAGETPPDRSAVEFAQFVLSQLGYRPGPINGNFGEETRQALAAYQGSVGLPVDGVLSDDVLRRLRSDRLARLAGG